jgi:hypothetical protein
VAESNRVEGHAANEPSAWRHFLAGYGPLLVLAFVGFFVVPELAPSPGVHHDQRPATSNTFYPTREANQSPSSTPTAMANPIERMPAAEATPPDVEEVATAFSLDGIPTKLDSLINDSSANGGDWRQLLVRRWAEAQPAAAADWAAAHFSSAGGPTLLKQAAVVLANSNLSAAIDWVEGLRAVDAKQAASIAVAYEAARSDPVQALNLGIPLPASDARDQLLVYGMRQYAEKDPEAASRWAIQVEDPVLRNRLLEAVTTSASGTDPASAARLVFTSMTPGQDQNRAAVSVVQRWAQISPESAAAWVATFPAGAVRTDATQNLVGIWSQRDRQAATSWLSTLPEGKPLASAAPQSGRSAPFF